jgi:enoyl-CoA hydratase/carnithine racemase
VTPPLVEVRRAGPAVIVALRREAKLNALSTALEAALDDALRRPEVRAAACVVIAGGERAFSAGADLAEVHGRDAAGVLDYYARSGGVYERVAALPQPTVSAISGWCLGAGLELALATDFRVAEPGAVFGLPEVGLGIIPSSGGLQRLVRLLGTARAKRLVLLGDRFGAEEALGLGLLTEISPPAAALDRALALADRLTALPPTAVAVAKQVIDAMPDASREAGLALERLAYGMLSAGPDRFGRPPAQASASSADSAPRTAS